MIVLDTSVLSAVYRRRRRGPQEEQVAAELAKLLHRGLALGVPGIVLQELLSGARVREQVERIESELRDLEVLLATREEHVSAAGIFNACAAGGVAASIPDCLIAATAIARGGSLFTTDPDFAAMAPRCGLALHRPA